MGAAAQRRHELVRAPGSRAGGPARGSGRGSRRPRVRVIGGVRFEAEPHPDHGRPRARPAASSRCEDPARGRRPRSARRPGPAPLVGQHRRRGASRLVGARRCGASRLLTLIALATIASFFFESRSALPISSSVGGRPSRSVRPAAIRRHFDQQARPCRPAAGSAWPLFITARLDRLLDPVAGVGAEPGLHRPRRSPRRRGAGRGSPPRSGPRSASPLPR